MCRTFRFSEFGCDQEDLSQLLNPSPGFMRCFRTIGISVGSAAENCEQPLSVCVFAVRVAIVRLQSGMHGFEH